MLSVEGMWSAVASSSVSLRHQAVKTWEPLVMCGGGWSLLIPHVLRWQSSLSLWTLARSSVPAGSPAAVEQGEEGRENANGKSNSHASTWPVPGLLQRRQWRRRAEDPGDLQVSLQDQNLDQPGGEGETPD